LDIETAPNIGYVWGLFDQNIGLNQIKETGYILSWAAKWIGKSEVHCRYRKDEDMFTAVHDLLSEADAVVHYNGAKFDVPWLNSAFLELGMHPPAPYHQVDLYRVVKAQFKFPSYKLAFVSPILGIGDKVDHMRFEDWDGCMKGDEKSWNKMIKYNKSDVRLTERLYNKLLPWIKGHPNVGLYGNNSEVCPSCGSRHYHKCGEQVTKAAVYKRLQCQDCGTWFRDKKIISETPKRFSRVVNS
jgi:DNA-directed RNA polymerase subunit RPC12/RpoP